MRIQINDDFNLQKIADSGQCFRACATPSGFRFITGNHVLYINPIGDSSFDVSCSEDEWVTTWHPYFDLDTDYASIRAKANDPYMKQAASFGAGIRILRQDPWETLISFIISQRKSIPSIRSCMEALARKYGHPVETGIDVIYTFPAAHELSCCSDLNDCKLGYRTPYVMDAARKVSSGVVNLAEIASFTNPDLLDRLMTIKGVGIKVASCVALFAYGRKDIAPIDTWIQKTIESHYAGNNPFPSYGNVAGVMQQYVFYKEQGRRA